jgi:hypothetical protein
MSFGKDNIPTTPIMTAAIPIGIKTWARVAIKLQTGVVIKNQLSNLI